MSAQEQIIYLVEAEKMFDSFDKIQIQFGKMKETNILKCLKHTKILEL